MSATLTVQAKVLGQKRPAPEWMIPFPETAAGEHQCLRDLITRIVLEEVSAFRDRQEQRKLLQVLSPAQIQLGVERGKVDLGGRDLEQAVDPSAAVGVALQAFVDGLYYVFLDEEQQLDLDRQVFVRADSRVTFLRLTPLAGG